MFEIRVGHVLDVLRDMASGAVQCVVTSPPYWGLRDYGLPPIVWGGDSGCEHEWGEELTARQSGGDIAKHWKTGGIKDWDRGKKSQGQFCQRCGAWQGSLGLEPSPELYVEHIVEVFREVWRVLRDDGAVWLNIGSSYAGRLMESDEMVLRDDLTPEERAYVLRELAKHEEDPETLP